MSGVDNGEFWTEKAKQLMAPVLFAAARTEATMAEVVKWLGLDRHELVATVGSALSDGSDEFTNNWGEEGSPPNDPSDVDVCLERLEALATTAENTYAGYSAVASTMVSVFAYRDVERRCRGGGLAVETLLDGRANTLYICAPSAEQRLYRPLFTALTREVLHQAYAHNTRAQDEDRIPLLVCLDEAGNIARLEELDIVTTTAAGTNIQLVTIFHDMSQLASAYGQSRARIIANNHYCLMFLPGNRDPETNDFLVSVLQNDSVRGLSHSGWNFGDLRKLDEKACLCIYGALPPLILSQRRWYEVKELLALGSSGVNGRPLSG